jgi:DeoR/GlpR family transcriptional regulator of sugar metabolism
MDSNKMFTSERFKMISEYLRGHSRATIDELSKLLYVSPATIRRDLNEMQKLGLIQRTHGGAVYAETADEVSIFARIAKNANDKEQTATIALPKIPDFQNLFIDNSSTCLALAERMDLSHKTIVTNGLEVAMSLAKKKDVKVIILGGDVAYNTNSADGGMTISMLQNFRFDLMLSSCASLRNDGTYEHAAQTMELKKAAYERADRHILIVDVHKFNENGMFRTQLLRDYDAIYTNAGDSLIAPLVKAGAPIVNH